MPKKDRYFIKKEKIADLLFDLVKYLLTTLGAILLLSEKPINLAVVVATVIIAAVIFTTAVLITPFKEE